MKKRNTLSAVAAILFAIILLSGVAIFFVYKNKTTPKESKIKIYYYDPISMELVPEEISARLPQSTTLKIEEVINMLKTPGQNGLFPVVNKDATLNSVTVKNGICTLDFGKSIRSIKPYSVRKEAIRVYGIVNTLTELPGINAVRITIDGQSTKYLARYIEIDKPLTHFTSALPTGKDVFVYYGSPDLTKLLVQKRNILSVQNPTELGKEVLRELLNDPFGVTIPKDTTVKDFYIKSGGIGVVDFSEGILKNPVGSQGEQIRVLAIVNSLTELPDIKRVRILVNGKEIDTLYGSVDTSQPIERFMGLTNESNTLIGYFTLKIGNTVFFTPNLKNSNTENQIIELFNILKSPVEGEGTYISQGVKLDSYNISKKDNSLTLKVSAPTDEEDTFQLMADQLKLSYGEIPSISRINVYINGEKQ